MIFSKQLTSAFNRFERTGFRHFNKTKWPYLELRFVQLTNLVAGLGAAISLVQSFFELMAGQIFYGLSDLVGGSLMLLTLALNSFGFFTLSRIYILLILNLDIYYFNLISNFSSDLEELYFMFLLFPFFLFSAKEKFSLILTTVIPCVLYCINRFYTEYNFIPEIYRQAAPTWYGAAVPLVVFLVTFLVIFRFLKINEEMQIKIIHNSKFSSLGEMAAGISHEINNPMTAIILNVELLQKDLEQKSISPESIKSRLARIDRSVTHVAEIIQGLKLFSRAAESDPSTTVDLKQCILETLHLCHQRFVLAGIHLESSLKDNLHVHGNPTQISQVLVNLLNNAFDAVVGKSQKWVQVTIALEDNWVEIRVSDSGLGVPPKIQRKIMEPFFTTKDVGHGTGLGLSISKGIAESHRGQLFLDTKAKHTTFVLRLPALQSG